MKKNRRQFPVLLYKGIERRRRRPNRDEQWILNIYLAMHQMNATPMPELEGERRNFWQKLN